MRTMEGGSGDMTLAFGLDALRALVDPGSVFSDARGWSEYVGVVSEEPTYVVTNFTRNAGIRQDFFSGPRGVEESLDSVLSQFDTERYVFIGASADEEGIAERTGWEYLDIADAADAAGWTLAATEEEEAAPEEDIREDWP